MLTSKSNSPIQAPNYLIIGQGIAGSVLAISMIQRGIQCTVLDENKPITSSKIAAGLWNPVVFKRLTKGWNADVLIEALNQFYPAAERLLDASFFNPIPIVKKLHDASQYNDWCAKSAESGFSQFLSTEIDDVCIPKNVDVTFFGKVLQTGYINVSVFLESVRRFLIAKGAFNEAVYNAGNLTITDTGANYNGIVYDGVVFAQGTAIKHNSFSEHLPLVNTKGQTIVVKAPELVLDFVINGGVFIQPLGNQLYRIGSTFEWNHTHTNPDDAGLAFLKAGFDELYSGQYEVVGHFAAERPTTKDRRPMVGQIANLPLYVFNGMGTKGILNAPWCATQLVDYLEHGKPISNEIDSNRFNPK